ncbi:MAG: tRNA (adenosine(37)-N6)-threonylcarbamoyltransferase complex ATPase subunit type 1 TsaE [Siphonobacter sp.]
MQEKTIYCPSLTELSETARQILAFGKDQNVWLFEGEMGAGKTTFIKALCRELGVLQTVQSPTFGLVNEYLTDQGETVYHFDFYRIKSEMEALDMGVEEYFDSGDFCFVEWPSRITGLWPDDRLEIEISVDEQQQRIFLLKKY